MHKVNKALNAFKHLRERKWRYVFYNIRDDDKIFVGACGERTNTFDDFLKEKESTKDEPCWVTYDMEYSKVEFGVEGKKSKLMIIIYAPDECTIPAKRAKVLFQKTRFMKELTKGVV